MKFINDNGQIEVDIKVKQEEEKLYIHLKNDGPSISKKDAQLIFNKFVQIENHTRRTKRADHNCSGSMEGARCLKSAVHRYRSRIPSG